MEILKFAFTGLRPGEKLYEELLLGDNVVKSDHPMIMRAIEEKITMDEVLDCVRIIRDARKDQDPEIV